MYQDDKKILSFTINSLMFLVIHFPKWIATGTFLTIFNGFGFLSVIVLSVIFSSYFIKYKSIIPSIVLHMYWDLLMFMFY